MSTEDGIEKVIGRFGKYQTWILFLITIGQLPTQFQLNIVVFLIPGVEYQCLDNGGNDTNYCPCQNPQYDQTTIVSSIVTEWNLICDRGNLASLAQSIMQIGILAGSLIFGYVSDRYGRKVAVLVSLILEAVFIAISGLVPEFWMFMICRFLIGTAAGGIMLCAYVYLIELSGKSFRPYLIGLFEISYILGYFTLPIIAYFVREWRILQLVTSAPWIVVFVYYWMLPESPRWLITMGKKQEAITLLTHIAKKNNRSTENIQEIVEEMEKESMRGTQKPATYADLFKTSRIRFNIIVTAFIWMCCAHTYFGVNQYIGRLQGNIYINVMLSAISLTPGIIIVVFATLYLKRKVSVITSFSIAALSLLVFIFIPSDREALSLTFAIIGLIGAYTSFVQVYLFTSEVFPTIIRNSAMGFASMFARFGAFIAPFVVNLGTEWVSILIFSGVALVAACLCYLLPETKDIILLNSIEQTERQQNVTTTKNNNDPSNLTTL